MTTQHITYCLGDRKIEIFYVNNFTILIISTPDLIKRPINILPLVQLNN